MKNNILIALVVLISFSCVAQTNQVKQVTSEEASKLLSANKNIIVLDVRTREEFEMGHIKGAINIDINDTEAFSQIDKLDRKSQYIVHCRTNHRSKIAVDHMKEAGFENIFQLSDGYNGWSQNGLPVVNNK